MNKAIHILLLLLFCTAGTGWATHNRAGQIVYKHISGHTYEFTVTTFTYTLSAADRSELDISWGDNTVSTMYRDASKIEMLPDNYKKNVYVIRHTFPGSGVYSVVVEDPNRNLGVENIPNSVSVVFSVKTIFRIDPNLGANNAPELLTYPIDKAALGQVFIHNPSAFDIDGDSLSYELTTCTRDRGIEIEDYSLPEASDSLVVNPITGDLIWAAPMKKGIYNIAMKIDEWRKGVKIGSIARDMQIEVVDSKNRPPVIEPISSRCVEAGTKLDFVIRSTDPDNDLIVLSATGGPFELSSNKAEFNTIGSGNGFANARFTWQTDHSHVRKQPYSISVKAEDQNQEVKLVNFANFNITVLAPKIENLTAVAEKKTIRLNWSPTLSNHAAGYEIYRSVGPNAVNPDSCSGGIPAESGYEKIATIDGIQQTSFEDNNDGKGLSPGIDYCYRVVAYFSDGAKSFPSDEACAVLLAGTPPMILADVVSIDPLGTIDVAWLRKPLDDIIAGKPGPFEYRLFYSEDMNGSWSELYRTVVPDTDLKDTTFTHTLVDTKNKYRHYYKVELWDRENGGESLLEEDFEIASTLYPGLEPSDRSVNISFERYTPWVNTEYTVYRCIKTGTDICMPVDSVGFTAKETYTDTGLKNGQEYCYRIRSRGYRKINGITYENENMSHVACIIPYDNVPPCTPVLDGKSLCEENRNLLEWIYDPSCMYDVEKYRIFYTPDRIRAYEKIDSVMNRDQANYSHTNVLVGCYYITAVDSTGNESEASNIICLDECGKYDLPNVFTPDGDNINDVFKAFNPSGIKQVEMKVFNRWGKLVFKTNDPNINWDGRDKDSKRFVPTGVYYYTCDVYEDRLTGSKINTLSGFIHVYTGKDAKAFEQ
ncbi:MAG: gliding motility-associated C-terminal domain-containing protein [Bacteroidales bacterium]|jgi:gliding motility-associated-like protein|nr:gliding motility-associated C-terminal domain-containing protein [Bacteroidales bacterium]